MNAIGRLSLCVVLGGCASTRGALLEPGEPGFAGIAAEVAKQTGCDSREIVVTVTSPAVRRGKAGFQASLCKREFNCIAGVNRHADVVEDETSCLESMASAERTVSIVAIDRLAIETGCPVENIKLLGKTPWVSGAERAYRLEACAKIYVCTTAAGKTDCKLALSHASPPATVAPVTASSPEGCPAEAQPAWGAASAAEKREMSRRCLPPPPIVEAAPL